jgi:hypothetical protein
LAIWQHRWKRYRIEQVAYGWTGLLLGK